jgi:hypothetical protein
MVLGGLFSSVTRTSARRTRAKESKIQVTINIIVPTAIGKRAMKLSFFFVIISSPAFIFQFNLIGVAFQDSELLHSL